MRTIFHRLLTSPWMNLLLLLLLLATLSVSLQTQQDIRTRASFSRDDFANWLRKLQQITSIPKPLKSTPSPKPLSRVGSQKGSLPCGNFCPTPPKDFEVLIYYPADNNNQPDRSVAPYPLVVFLHGFGANGEYYTWLGEDLAAKGYVVVLPSRLQMFSYDFNGGVYLINGSIDYMLKRNTTNGDIFYQIINPNSVGVGGHSLGADTSLLIASQSNAGTQIKALIAFSPAYFEFDKMSVTEVESSRPKLKQLGIVDDLKKAKEIFERIMASVKGSKIPLMYQVGSRDGMSPPEMVEQLFNPSVPPKAFVEIEGGNHVQFIEASIEIINKIAGLFDDRPTITRSKQQEIADKYFSAWFNYYLKSDQSALAILQNGSQDVPSTLTKYVFTP